VQRIQELFPHEEERNEDLQRLYMAVGWTPRYAATALPPREAAAPTPAPISDATHAPDTTDVNSLTRVTEVSRKLNRQGNAEAVMSVAANEIGAQWNVSRCLVALRKPGLPPTALTEYCAPEVQASTPNLQDQIVAVAQDHAISRGALIVPNIQVAAELAPVREALTAMGVSALLALPLTDGKEQMGVLLLLHSAPRAWHSNDVMVLRTISEQIVIALNNAGLRRLVKNLSVTDEGSGLLKRASYLDLLMSETRRALQQRVPLTVLLMQFGKSGPLLKEHPAERFGDSLRHHDHRVGAQRRRGEGRDLRREPLAQTDRRSAHAGTRRARTIFLRHCRSRPAPRVRSGGHCHRSDQPGRARTG
jgi:hypothetical protein